MAESHYRASVNGAELDFFISAAGVRQVSQVPVICTCGCVKFNLRVNATTLIPAMFHCAGCGTHFPLRSMQAKPDIEYLWPLPSEAELATKRAFGKKLDLYEQARQDRLKRQRTPQPPPRPKHQGFYYTSGFSTPSNSSF